MTDDEIEDRAEIRRLKAAIRRKKLRNWLQKFELIRLKIFASMVLLLRALLGFRTMYMTGLLIKWVFTEDAKARLNLDNKIHDAERDGR